MITPLADAPNGKENQPGSNFFAQPSKNAKSGAMGSGKGITDKKKRGDTKGKDQAQNSEEMNEAFDQLLVRYKPS